MNIFETFNAVIALIMVYFIFKNNNTATSLMVMFIYGGLHFSFGVSALFSNNYNRDFIALHESGSGIISKISAISVFFVAVSNIIYNKKNNLKKSNLFVINFVLILVLFIIGFITKFRVNDFLQIKNIASFILIIFIILSVLYSGKLNFEDLKSSIKTLFLFLSCMAIVSLYEVLLGKTWAGTLESSGIYVYRASSTFFNPNLQGYWASLVYLGGSFYLMKTWNTRIFKAVLILIISALLIYLSGSRSAFYALLVSLFVPLFLNRGYIKFLPIFILIGTMLAIYSFTLIMIFIFGDMEFLYNLKSLGPRFFKAIQNMYCYSLKLFGLNNLGSCYVYPEIIESIEGRFTGEGRDSGWAVLYLDTGIIGLLSIAYGTLLLFYYAMKAYLIKPNSDSAYAIATLVNCILVGFYMRLQIYPVWMILGIMLSVCLIYWRHVSRELSKELKNRGANV